VLTLSKKVEYALIAMLHMARKPGSDLATAKEMADQYNIPCELLGKVLQSLARGKLIVSTQGSRGGYQLQRPVELITLGQVIEAVEGPVLLTRCQEDPTTCGQFHACTIKEPIQHLHDQLIQFIHGISLGVFRMSSSVEHNPLSKAVIGL
jgi:Rrf2 family protein